MDTPRTIGFESLQDSSPNEAATTDAVASALRWLLLLTTVLVVFGLTML